MKRQIRSGVFETNSSSMHSLTIKKKSEYYTREEINEDIYVHDGIWSLYEFNMNYGRSPFNCLNTFRDKFYYCVCALCKEYKDDVWNQLEEIARKYVDGLVNVRPPMSHEWKENKSNDCKYGMTEEELAQYLDKKQEEYGMKLDYWEDKKGDFHYDFPDVGYAEDYGMTKNFLNKTGISLEEFLTNKRYVIIVDGDEYCVYDKLKEAGLINMDEIEYEYPNRYKLYEVDDE